MKLKVFKKGFNFAQDGPGNRLVMHLQGCNMHCPWCANPEGMALHGALMVNFGLLLDEVCPFGAIREGRRDAVLCKACTSRVCVSPETRNAGIRLSYEEENTEELAEMAAACQALFFAGGGVTITGGEPTLQFEAVKELLIALKEKNIDTALETNATSCRLGELLPLIDHLIVDYKIPVSNRHKHFTGAADSVIKQNISLAGMRHRDILVRTPLIRGVNDKKEDCEAFLEFYKTCRTCNMMFEFLPYHEYGKVKWEQCGMEYRMGNAFVDEATVRLFIESFQEAGFHVVAT